MIHKKYDIYQSLVENPYSKFFMVDIYQIFMFRQWHHTTFIRNPTSNESDILYKLTEEKWDECFDTYISENLQKQLLYQIYIESLICIQESTIKVVIYAFPTTNGNMEHHTKYQTNSVFTSTEHEHKQYIEKPAIYQILSRISINTHIIF